MTHSLKDKYKLGADRNAEELEVDARPEEYAAFRLDPQARPSNALIDFWLSDGDQHAIAYNHLYDVRLQRSEGLVLTFSEHQVTIRGHCLDELYRGLKRHRVVFVWEAARQEAVLATDDQPLVTEIVIQTRQEALAPG